MNIKDLDPNKIELMEDGPLLNLKDLDPSKISVVSDMPTEEPTSNVSDFLQAMGQGATFGFSDEMLAALDVLRGKAEDKDASLYEKYRQLQKLREEEYEKVLKRSPGLAFAGEMAGGFLVPVPGAAAGTLAKTMGITGGLAKLGFKPQMASHIGTGIVAGGTAGLGTSKGTVGATLGLEEGEGVLPDVLTTSAVGGGVGGVVGPLVDLGGKFLSNVKDNPIARAAKAAFELESGTRPGYEGQKIKTSGSPELDPTLPMSGTQSIKKKAEDLAEDQAIKATNIQREAKRNLSNVIQEAKETAVNRPLGEEHYLDAVDEIKIRNEAIDRTITREVIPALQSAEADFMKNKPENFTGTILDYLRSKYGDRSAKFYNWATETLKLQNPYDILDNFGDYSFIYEIFENDFHNIRKRAEISYYKKFLNDPEYGKTFSALLDIEKIARNKESVKKALESIDRDFFKKLADSNTLTVEDVVNLRKMFLSPRFNEAVSENKLSPADLVFLRGEETIDPRTNKTIYKGGLLDKLEELLNSADPRILQGVQQVKDRSQHIETLLNRSDDQRFHAMKAWDFSDEELKKALREEFLRIAQDVGSPSDISSKSGSRMREYFDVLLRNHPELESQIKKDASLFEEMGAELAVTPTTGGVDRTADLKLRSAISPKSMIQESGLVSSAAKLGRMRANIGETVEQFPSGVRSLVGGTVKLPFSIRNATKEQLEEVAEFLAKSESPAVSKFGEAMKQSNLENPSARAAFLNSAFQSEHIRRTLGLTLGEQKKKEE